MVGLQETQYKVRIKNTHIDWKTAIVSQILYEIQYNTIRLKNTGKNHEILVTIAVPVIRQNVQDDVLSMMKLNEIQHHIIILPNLIKY